VKQKTEYFLLAIISGEILSTHSLFKRFRQQYVPCTVGANLLSDNTTGFGGQVLSSIIIQINATVENKFH